MAKSDWENIRNGVRETIHSDRTMSPDERNKFTNIAFSAINIAEGLVTAMQEFFNAKR